MNIDKLIQERFDIECDNLNKAPFIGNIKYDRVDLIKLFKDLGLKYGAEIGVHKGNFSRTMLKIIPDLKLLCIDEWAEYGISGYGEGCDKIAKRRLKNLNAVIIKNSSIEASKNIKDGSLDFVYIDANHEFDYMMIDTILWTKKVRSGGIVSGHDFVKNKNCGVVEAVEVYTKVHNIKTWYITNSKGNQSFFWVKK